MVYKYQNWTLYKIEPNFKNIGKRTMYFFSMKNPERGTPCDMPEGYKVNINSRSGLPFLKYANKISVHERQKQSRMTNEK